MAEKAHYPDNKGLKKRIGNKTYYLGRSWDLIHGKGWFCQVFDENSHVGFGFHGTNKFSAVRYALKILQMGGY